MCTGECVQWWVCALVSVWSGGCVQWCVCALVSVCTGGGIVSKLVHWFKHYGFIKLLVEVLPHIKNGLGTKLVKYNRKLSHR